MILFPAANKAGRRSATRFGRSLCRGLTAEALTKANPQLIHCSITGFGTDGPYHEHLGYDTVGIALSGILHLYLDPKKPQIVGPTLSDDVTGLYAFGGILAALHARNKSEFVAFARSRPNGVNYSSPGIGTTPQLSSELLRVRGSIPMVHVPYNSGPLAVQALPTDLVQLLCSAVPLVQPHIAAGTLSRWRLRALLDGADYRTCRRCEKPA